MVQGTQQTFKLHGKECILIGQHVHEVIGYTGPKDSRRMQISGRGHWVPLVEIQRAIRDSERYGNNRTEEAAE